MMTNTLNKNNNLHKQTCDACSADAPLVSDEELAVLIKLIPEWSPIVEDGAMRLRREFNFGSYQAGVDFTVQVAVIAEENQHHPDILTEWGKVTVTWWSHKIKGLHKNDFILSAKTDRLYSA